jgi:hypothetical protein
MKNFRISTAVVVTTLAVFVAGQARASINYGNFVGTTVTYLNVTEASPSNDPLPLFGAPTIAGNTLDFNPVGFSASASGGSFDLTDGQLDLTILANPGNAIPTIQFSEAGDFTLGGVGTAGTFVDVSATFFIDIVKVDGVSINPILATASMNFSPVASGTFDLVNNPGFGQVWAGVFTFDVNAFLTANNISYISGATEIKVTLDNTLAAFSEAGTAALIAKKDFKGLGITVPEIPEPTILTLLLCGGGALWVRSRKAQKA